MTAINSIQEEIIEEFEILSGDREATIEYIMELGGKLPHFPDKWKTDENIVKGCQSKVWLVSELQDDKLVLHADSNTAITKGLISLLIRVLSEHPVSEIINNDLYFIEKIGMGQVIGSQRSNGFAAMIKQIKLFALVYQKQLEK